MRGLLKRPPTTISALRSMRCLVGSAVNYIRAEVEKCPVWMDDLVEIRGAAKGAGGTGRCRLSVEISSRNSLHLFHQRLLVQDFPIPQATIEKSFEAIQRVLLLRIERITLRN